VLHVRGCIWKNPSSTLARDKAKVEYISGGQPSLYDSNPHSKRDQAMFCSLWCSAHEFLKDVVISNMKRQWTDAVFPVLPYFQIISSSKWRYKVEMDIDHKNCQTTCNKFVTTSIILITSSPLAHYIIGLDAKQLYLNVFEFQQH